MTNYTKLRELRELRELRIYLYKAVNIKLRDGNLTVVNYNAIFLPMRMIHTCDLFLCIQSLRQANL